MQKGLKYSSPEAEERERRHQFGQPEGNRLGDPRNAVNQRDFYRWAESKATKADLENYIKDETNPFSRRKFVEALTRCVTVQDFFDLTNQTHGQPKQVIESVEVPTIIIELDEKQRRKADGK